MVEKPRRKTSPKSVGASSQQADLAKAFSAVTRELKKNQESLNAADDFNHNHGDNMVKNFQVITNAVREKKNAAPAEQLAYASQALAKRSSTGSAKLYAQGLADASKRLSNKDTLTPDSAMIMVQSLMGSGQAAPTKAKPSQDDLLGGLVGSFMGQESSSQPSQPGDLSGLMGALMGGESSSQSSQSGDLSGLMGALMGGGASSQSSSDGKLDMGDLLSIGMAFMQAKQQGKDTLPALVQAVMSGSQMNNTASHSQSGQLVTQTLLGTLGKLLGGSKK